MIRVWLHCFAVQAVAGDGRVRSFGPSGSWVCSSVQMAYERVQHTLYVRAYTIFIILL